MQLIVFGILQLIGCSRSSGGLLIAMWRRSQAEVFIFPGRWQTVAEFPLNFAGGSRSDKVEGIKAFVKKRYTTGRKNGQNAYLVAGQNADIKVHTCSVVYAFL